MTAVIAVFARPPIAGATKTRLAAIVGDAQAAALALAFLRDTLAACTRLRELCADRTEIELWSADAGDDPTLAEAARTSAATLQRQPRGDLGQRMRAALDAATARRAKGIVVGSDAPTLPSRYLGDALVALDDADLVLGPAADGGYWLIGARSPLPTTLFDDVPWSSTSTRDATIARAVAAGLHVAALSPWYDVDEPDDLRLLAAHLAIDPAAAPATALALGLVGARLDARLNAGAP